MRVGEDGVSFSAVLQGENFRAKVEDLEALEFHIDRVDDGVYLGVQADDQHATIQLTDEAVALVARHLKGVVDGQQAGGVTHD